MPKFHPTPIIQDCWSSIGNITFYHRNGQCFYKRKPYTQYRGTAAQLGREHIPVPQPYSLFPISHLQLLQIDSTGSSGSVSLHCRLTLQNTDNPARWHVSARIQLTAPGVGCDPGKMRTYMGIRNQQNEIVFNVPCPDTEDFQVHLRYRLVDSVTGYRNNWKKYL